MSRVGKILTGMWSERRATAQLNVTGSINDVSDVYEKFEPYSLGVYYGDKIKRKVRKEIYTDYKIMMQDPTIHAALNLLVTAALGGHESRGEVVFIRPKDKILGKGIRAKELRKLVEAEAEYLESLINSVVFAFARNAIGYGDSFMRVYPKKDVGVSHVLCDETVEPPLIQAFEQAGRTVGYHVLEVNDYEIRHISKLNKHQMLRMKMQRVTPLPQFRIDHVLHKQLLATDDLSEVPIIPSPVGGSFLQAVEPAWKDWILNFAALNSQQIADSVNNQFMSLDVSSMPEAARAEYKQGLKTALQGLQDKVRNALQGGDPLWMTNWTFLPSWGEKQVLNPLGDLTQRGSPLSMELAMTHLKRGVGALGLDISLLGWMEMISGGLGDGAAFHTSAQVMQNSVLIRQALTEPLIDLCIMHFAYKYGKVFKRGDLPFKIDFYSDISAAATEALNNKATRANNLGMTTASLAGLKELNLSEETIYLLLTETLGMDDAQALKFAKDLSRSAERAEGEKGEGDLDTGDDE